MKGTKMNKTIKNVLTGIMMIPMIALGVSVFNPAPQLASADAKTSIEDGFGNSGGTENTTELPDLFKNIINTALYVVGAVSVLMLIYGGIRYTISGGNTQDVTAAKNTVLYAIVGIVVSLLAYAIVNFVIDQITKT